MKKRIFVLFSMLMITCMLWGCGSDSDKTAYEVDEKYDYDFDRDELYNAGEQTVYGNTMKSREISDLNLLDLIYSGIINGLATEKVYNELDNFMETDSIIQFTLDDMYEDDFMFTYLATEVRAIISNKIELEADCNKDGTIVILIAKESDFEVCVYVKDKNDKVIVSEFLNYDSEYKKMIVGDLELIEIKSVPDVYKMSESDAVAAIEKAGLKYVIDRDNSNDVEEGLVCAQSINAHKIVSAGTKVIITISEGKKKDNIAKKYAEAIVGKVDGNWLYGIAGIELLDLNGDDVLDVKAQYENPSMYGSYISVYFLYINGQVEEIYTASNASGRCYYMFFKNNATQELRVISHWQYSQQEIYYVFEDGKNGWSKEKVCGVEVEDLLNITTSDTYNYIEGQGKVDIATYNAYVTSLTEGYTQFKPEVEISVCGLLKSTECNVEKVESLLSTYFD